MTWTSDRSGRASSGVFITATTPPMTMNNVASRTRNGFLPDHSMTLVSMVVPDQRPEGVIAADLAAAGLIDVITHSPGWRSTNSNVTGAPCFRDCSSDGLATLNSMVIGGRQISRDQ